MAAQKRANGKSYHRPDDCKRSLIWLREDEHSLIQKAAEAEGLAMTDILRLGGIEKARKILKRAAVE